MDNLFNEKFKFKINDKVRHKGDSHKYDADMGLLILERHLVQGLGDNGDFTYDKSYVCRVIAWSKSGDLVRFKEKELMDITEYNEQKTKEDAERNGMRNECRIVEKEIMEIFDISKEDYLYEIVNGKADTTKKFRMTGFAQDENGIRIHVRESLFTASNRSKEGEKVEPEKRDWVSKSQFQKVQ